MLLKTADEGSAVNSMPLVTKVRFVASTLLDALTSPNNTGDESAPASQRTRRAQTYLCKPSHEGPGAYADVVPRGLLEDLERD